jgi:hypothetical protein
MRLSRNSEIGLCFLLCAAALPLCRAQAIDAAQEETPSTIPATEQLAYPLVIRIDHAALDTLTAGDINDRSHVDMMILGTRAVGDNFATGAMSVRLIPDRDEASFDLTFQGRTHARTVGTNGPAVIYSHIDTAFVCTRPVSFDATQGFVAGKTKITATTKLVYDGFGASRTGLGRRLISRVAEKRSNESHEQARQIAARDTERKILSSFDKVVDSQLATMNRQLNIVWYTNLFVGKGLAMQFAARSSKDCIHIGFGKQGSPSRLTVIPTRREVSAPIEIWVHPSVLGEQVTKHLTLVDNKLVLPKASQAEILQALALPSTGSGSIIDLQASDGWIVYSLQNAPLASAATALTQRSRPLDVKAGGGK